MMTLTELQELLKQRKKEAEEVRRELAELWLTRYLKPRERRKYGRIVKETEMRLEEAEALLYPLVENKIGFERR